MTLNEAKAALAELESTLYAYEHAMGVIYYDAETVAPRRSAVGRGKALAVLSGVVHKTVTDPRTREICETILAEGETLDRVTRRRAEVLRDRYEDLTRIPAQEYAAYRALLSEASAAWHSAKEQSDYAAFAPYLERIVAFNRRLAAWKDEKLPAYDVLLGTYEKGLNQAQLDPFFALLREELTPVILAVGEKPRPEAEFLGRFCSIERQRAFTDRLMQILGIDRADCSVGETEHPFTSMMDKHNVRITTHYHENNVVSSMYSVIHESGHALYELGIADELQGTLLAGGTAMSVHESQSRFYENYIGRSRPFCEYLLPVLREFFPEQMADVTADALYRGVNLAEPTLVRTQADELTYPMHVMIRYELEKAMIAGEVAIRDVPGEWNAMYKKYLGLDVPDDRRGCLQDSHWSTGYIGYFPSYALGSAYGAQMLPAMERDADIWPSVGRGDLTPVTSWLREKVHRHGKLLRPGEVIQNACGAPFDPHYYTGYLKNKYGALYAL